MGTTEQANPESLAVLGYIVRSSIFPAFAVVVVRYKDKPAIIFPGTTELQQVENIDTENELRSKSDHYIPLNDGAVASIVPGRDTAFAFSRDDIVLLPNVELYYELTRRRLAETNPKNWLVYYHAAKELLSLC